MCDAIKTDNGMNLPCSVFLYSPNYVIYKMFENNIIFIDSFVIETHKTKNLENKLSKFNYKSALFVYGDESEDNNFKMASSNLPRVSSLSHKGINVKDIISYDKIFIEEKSINKISERLTWKN